MSIRKYSEWLVALSFDMKQPKLHFVPPGLVARAVNSLFGQLASFGFGPSYSFLLLTKGRKTEMTHSTPVNLLRCDGKFYLVGTPNGRVTLWWLER